MTRAYVIVRVEPDQGELRIQSITVASDMSAQGPSSEIILSWFHMAAGTYAEAYRKCIESIAFQLVANDSLRTAVMMALAPVLRDEVICEIAVIKGR